MTKFNKLIYKRQLRFNMFYYNKIDFHDEFSLTSLAKLGSCRFYFVRLLSKFI